LIILVSIVDLARLLGGSQAARRNSIVSTASRSSRGQVLSTPKSLSREAVMQACSKLRRNCARIVPGRLTRSVRRKNKHSQRISTQR
jgi:hypothetical protein